MVDSVAEVLDTLVEPVEVARQIVEACHEVKGQDIRVLDVSGIFDLSNYFVVVSGRSDRQVQGITNRVIESMAKLGYKPISIEGFEDGQWVLVDFGDVVLHVFYESVRQHYDIEGLWIKARPVDFQSARKFGKIQQHAA
jgi:ribosome-associated protein